jgi:membrane dipeptidase
MHDAQPYKRLHFNSFFAIRITISSAPALRKVTVLMKILPAKHTSDLNRMFKAGVDVQVFSIWCDGTQTNPYAFANR